MQNLFHHIKYIKKIEAENKIRSRKGAKSSKSSQLGLGDVTRVTNYKSANKYYKNVVQLIVNEHFTGKHLKVFPAN